MLGFDLPHVATPLSARLLPELLQQSGAFLLSTEEGTPAFQQKSHIFRFRQSWTPPQAWRHNVYTRFDKGIIFCHEITELLSGMYGVSTQADRIINEVLHLLYATVFAVETRTTHNDLRLDPIALVVFVSTST